MSQTIEELKQKNDERQVALHAAFAILQMDPNAREDLICYLRDLNEAFRTGDTESQAYLSKAILEVFEVGDANESGDIADWEQEVVRGEEGKKAAMKLEGETKQFFTEYEKCKAATGLTTVRAVAEAAGISPTTVQAIEKQRVKPQFKTLLALAKAFNVPVVKLSGKGGASEG